VEIFTHKSGFKSPPAFDLTYLRDGKWYDFFVDQFEEMWKDAKPWELASTLPKGEAEL
jgi:hypothetical protein